MAAKAAARLAGRRAGQPVACPGFAAFGERLSPAQRHFHAARPAAGSGRSGKPRSIAAPHRPPGRTCARTRARTRRSPEPARQRIAQHLAHPCRPAQHFCTPGSGPSQSASHCLARQRAFAGSAAPCQPGGGRSRARSFGKRPAFGARDRMAGAFGRRQGCRRAVMVAVTLAGRPRLPGRCGAGLAAASRVAAAQRAARGLEPGCNRSFAAAGAKSGAQAGTRPAFGHGRAPDDSRPLRRRAAPGAQPAGQSAPSRTGGPADERHLDECRAALRTDCPQHRQRGDRPGDHRR